MMPHSHSLSHAHFAGEHDLVALLPTYPAPKTLLVVDQYPSLKAQFYAAPLKDILQSLQRTRWTENLYVHQTELVQLKRYRNVDQHYKNTFTAKQFLHWVKLIEENTAICTMKNPALGKGVVVAPGKKLPAATFIPSSGIIKFNPTPEELETKTHCSALQDFNTPNKEIYGLIDPAQFGGLLDLINHAPTHEELKYFNFKSSAIKQQVATANLRGTIKFYAGYAIMGVEVIEDIAGGEFGQQLLWSYAQPWEYLASSTSATSKAKLLLFDKRKPYNGVSIDPKQYYLREIQILIDHGTLILNKVASLTHWELMHSEPHAMLVIRNEDPFSSHCSQPITAPIAYGDLQKYLTKHPTAERIIIKIPHFVPSPVLTNNHPKDKNARHA